MAEPETILEADGFRVAFFRRGDRYAHRVEVFDAAKNQWQATLESLEGQPGDEWPPSPPFQQLHVERRATGNVVLLIGMAGKTHWSAAVEVAVNRKSIQFDVAARVQVVPESLRSSYRYSRPLEWPEQIRISSDSGTYQERNAEDGSYREIAMLNKYNASAIPYPTTPTTIDWRYSVRNKPD